MLEMLFIWERQARDDGSQVHSHTWVHVTMKPMNNTHLLRESGGVKLLSRGGEAAELLFRFRAQESDGGQSDVCVLKVLLDLVRVLRNDREEKTNITNEDIV